MKEILEPREGRKTAKRNELTENSKWHKRNEKNSFWIQFRTFDINITCDRCISTRCFSFASLQIAFLSICIQMRIQDRAQVKHDGILTIPTTTYGNGKAKRLHKFHNFSNQTPVVSCHRYCWSIIEPRNLRSSKMHYLKLCIRCKTHANNHNQCH